MRKKTLKKKGFFELENCLQANENAIRKNYWDLHFPKIQPLILELGCGRAEFSNYLAGIFPHNNYIGIDSRHVRLFDAGTLANQLQLHNIAFCNMDIYQITAHFEPNSIEKIWITFPDPYPKSKHEKKRLTNKTFLMKYKEILKKGGEIHFKTDNDELFDFSLEVLKELGIEYKGMTRDLHASDLKNDETGSLTFYETRFIKEGIKTKYVYFSFE